MTTRHSNMEEEDVKTEPRQMESGRVESPPSESQAMEQVKLSPPSQNYVTSTPTTEPHKPSETQQDQYRQSLLQVYQSSPKQSTLSEDYARTYVTLQGPSDQQQQQRHQLQQQQEQQQHEQQVAYVSLEDFFIADDSVGQEQVVTAVDTSSSSGGGGQTYIIATVPEQVLNVTLPTEPLPISNSRMGSSSLTPSPSSSNSSSFDRDDQSPVKDVEASVPIQIVRPTQLNTPTSILPSSPPMTEGSDDQLSAAEDTHSVTSSSDADRKRSRRSKMPVPDEKKDEKYWRRRLKNNMAAKRSREARRQKESQLSVRATYLEKQHELLRLSLEKARHQNESLKERLSKYEDVSDLKLS